MSSIPGEDAAIAGQGRALIDWNKRHIFCSGCGRPTRSVWAGWKRACVPDLPGDPDVGSKPACFSKKGVHNFSYPRTDPVVIMAILDPSREKILLGRQRVWPSKFYSTLAGFIELGESIEEAVRREVYEEAGVRVAEVFYHSSQNWPFPASLMIGCIGIADEGQQIRTDLDNELEDARWFTKADVLVALGQDMTMTKEDHARMIQNQVQDEDKDKREDIQVSGDLSSSRRGMTDLAGRSACHLRLRLRIRSLRHGQRERMRSATRLACDCNRSCPPTMS